MNALWRGYRLLLVLLTVPVVARRLLATNARRARSVPSRRIIGLTLRTIRNSRRVETASSVLEHLTIVDSLLSIPDAVEGHAVECGAFKGGSTANLSLACALVGRELHVYDSFSGLPEPRAEDRAHHLVGRGVVHTYEREMFAASLDEVRGNVRRFGALSRCRFHPGFFEETMPSFDLPAVVLAFLDVDLRESFELCVRAIWPRLVDGGYLYVHEAQHREVASLFFDREWWQRELACPAPGLVGAGSGLGLDLGESYWESSLAFTRKNLAEDAYGVLPGNAQRRCYSPAPGRSSAWRAAWRSRDSE